MERRWNSDFSKYCYVLANESKYFKKVIEELFPEIKKEEWVEIQLLILYPLLDLLHDYKIHLIRYVEELEKMDKAQNF